MIAVFLGCIVAGLALYFLLIRPWVRPLTERIPHERKYWAGCYPRR